MDFIELRKQWIEKQFARMNNRQKEAVFQVNGPLLILAGAGSGKTTVLVNRIACLIRFGNAYHSDFTYRAPDENDCAELSGLIKDGGEPSDRLKTLLSVDAPRPWQILAITFTNKAANELKTRLIAMLGEDGLDVWAGTFHSICVRMIRRDSERLGYSKHFTIYDTDDSRRVMKEVERSLNIDEKRLPGKVILSEISKAKDVLETAADYASSAGLDPNRKIIAAAFGKYQHMLKDADAMDFDDIIVNAVKLLRENSDLLEYYQRRFRYVMVDEYQDTNHAQYVLTSLLAGGYNNIGVVGDDDQSIYKFRGATIENILSFEKQYRDAKVIKLEQNYRSTSVILDAANAVIKHNSERKGKALWTAKEGGDKVIVHETPDERDEGRYIADEILNAVATGRHFSDFAILYRTNAQSNSIERALVYEGVPYKVIGGHRFYDRKEVKDVIAYLAVIANPADAVRLRRIINEPKRGIGEATVQNAASIADGLGLSLFEVISNAAEYPLLSRSAAKLKSFTQMIEGFRSSLETSEIAEFYNTVITDSGYMDSLELDKETAEERKSNVMELMANLLHYFEENADGTLQGFLEEVALLSDIDNYSADSDSAVMMTLHSAKGLEFPVVFMAGMEEGLFPGNQVMYEPEQVEEERRLCYVGITRARERLYLTSARARMIYGNTSFTKPSRFVEEIPDELTESNIGEEKEDTFVSFGSRSYGGTKSTFGAPTHLSHRDTASGEKAKEKKNAWGFSGSASVPKKTGASVSEAPEFRVGDTVFHKVFGTGLIIGARAVGGDQLLEVAFETVGTKKLMAKMGKLEKV